MAQEEGYSKYKCDVQQCGRCDFAQPNTDKADGYVVRRRIDNNGVPRELMLCAEHNAVYGKLVDECEAAYTAFEHDGSFTLPTRAEIDELESRVSQLEAERDELAKDRDKWVAKYKALKAEYEDYKREHPADEGSEG